VIDHISQYTISVNMSNEDLHERIPLKAYILTLWIFYHYIVAESRKNLHYPAFDDNICIGVIKTEDWDKIKLPGYLV